MTIFLLNKLQPRVYIPCMKKMHLRCLLSSLVIYTASAHGETPSTENDCGYDPKSHRISISHIEGKGIGYKDGYTSLDLFFSDLHNNSLPFLNLRGHIFDDGRLASNVGIGYRQLWRDYVFGGNIYYDYRNTHRLNYNQISAGFEVLGKRWDFRINGYLPVGAKATRRLWKNLHGCKPSSKAQAWLALSGRNFVHHVGNKHVFTAGMVGFHPISPAFLTA